MIAIHDNKVIAGEARSTHARLLVAAAVLVGAVYFFVGHDVRVSSYERFAPWSDAKGTVEAAGGNAVKGVAIATIGFFGLYLLMRRDGRAMQAINGLQLAMAVFLAWAAMSVLWSGDPGLSCRRLAVLAFCVLGACGFARQFSARDIAVLAMGITAAYLLIGVAAEVAQGKFRPWAADYRFAGTVHPNTQGAHLAVLCLASFCLARFSDKRQAWLWWLFVIASVFLFLTKSRTSCAAVAIALGMLWMIGASPRARFLAVVASGFVVCGGILVGTMFGFDLQEKVSSVVLLGREQESEALTGRLPIWQELLGYVSQRPLQGYGYEAFWTLEHIEAVSEELEWPLREAHNAYIDALLSVGGVGLAAMLSVVGIAIWQLGIALRTQIATGFAFGFCLLVFGVLNACLETGMGSPNFLTLIAGSCVAQLLFATEMELVPCRKTSAAFSSQRWHLGSPS